MFIPVVLGTAREGRQSEKAAKFVYQEVKRFGVETDLVDVRNYLLLATDNTERSVMAKKWSEIMSRSDGLIIISPEYNHGYPGELKQMIDLIYPEYARKPLGICGVSSGLLGGGRMIEQLRLVSIELRMVPIREAIYFPQVADLFDEQGKIKDYGYYSKRIKTFLEELVWYARALKEARERRILNRRPL